MEITLKPTIPILGIHLEKNIILRGIPTPVFIAALFTTAKTLKQPKGPLTGD